MKKQGITVPSLILITSIAILGVSFIYTVWTQSEMRARDTRRINDFAIIRQAMELYFHDYNDYPVVSGGKPISSKDTEWGSFSSQLSSYLEGVPHDPINNASGPWIQGNYSYTYIYGEKDSNGVRLYDLITQLEDTKNPRICAERNWKIHTADDVSWCGTDTPEPYIANGMLYSDH
jgi:hypothetical protein